MEFLATMPIFRLSKELVFPPAHLANPDGILAVGGDTQPQRLLLAYQSGIFPWPHEGTPLLWFSPDPRFVLKPGQIHLGRSLKKAMQKTSLRIQADQAFTQVMKNCSQVFRKDQNGTWVTEEMIEGYSQLHRMGYAHSVEAYQGNELVGGLYGVSLGGIFFGESMFANAPDASKICFATLAGNLFKWDFDLIDCQSYTDHLKRFGAEMISRDQFLRALQVSLKRSSRLGKWELPLGPAESLACLQGVR